MILVTMKNFYTHDNGGRPFLVQYDSQKHLVSVRKRASPHGYSEKPVAKFKNVQKVWTPSRGAAVLVRLSAKMYAFIGDSVYTFQTLEPVTHFKANVGNNDVPYPVAWTSTMAYLTAEQVYFPLSLVSPYPKYKKNDLYFFYYDATATGRKYLSEEALPLSDRRRLKSKFKKFRKRVIVRREV